MFKVGDKIKIKDSYKFEDYMDEPNIERLRSITHIGDIYIAEKDNSISYYDLDNSLGTCHTIVIYDNDMTPITKIWEKVEN